MEPQNTQSNGEQSEPTSHDESNVTPNPNTNSSTTPRETSPVATTEPAHAVPQQPSGAALPPDASSPATATPVPSVPVPPAPASPHAPMQGAVISPNSVNGTQQPTAVVSGGLGSTRRKRRWLLPVVVAVVLILLLGGGYLFAFYLPNTPSAVYATSLKRTGEGLDALITYSNNYSQKGYKSTSFTGTVHSTGTASFDGSLNGSADTTGNASYKVDADVMGEKMNANILGVHVDGSKTPDIYVQLTGIKKELDSFGLNSIDSLDGKWVAVDHTLINSYVNQLNQNASGLTKGSLVPTSAQINDAVGKIQSVNKQYIFTADASKAVLANEKFIGKQTKDGRETYHYTVSYNKAHLKTYVSALGDALDSSSLNAWAKSANSGKSLSQTIDFQSIQKSIDKAKTGYTLDLWVDAKTKLVHSVAFADPSQPGSVFTLTQNYTGGTTYPFSIHINGKDPATGDIENVSVDVAIDTKSDATKGEMTVDQGKDLHMTLNFTATPSKNSVQVKAPTGAEPVMNLLAEWGLSNNNSGL